MLKINYQLKEDSERINKQFKPQESIGFGKLRTDHIFLMEYSNNKWHSPRIIPYQNISIPLGSLGLNISQSVFEGCKAFLHQDKDVYLFRIEEHAKRFNKSAKLLCMPKIDIKDQIQAIMALIDIDRLWCPDKENSFLYIRPIMFATEDCLAARDGTSYLYGIILSPSESLFGEKLKPIKLFLTQKFHRVAPGSIGAAKSGGNYASTLYALSYAKKIGTKQVLYCDVTNTYIEETGIANHYHVTKDNEIIIPKFSDTVLESITSKSIIELSKILCYKVKQENTTYKEFISGLKDGFIKEAGTLGTGAVISAVGSYILDNRKEIKVGNGKVGSISKKMYELLVGIQKGKVTAPKNWLLKV